MSQLAVVRIKLAKIVKANEAKIKKLILIGSAAQRLADILAREKFENYVVHTSKNMADIVATAKQFALPGDAIVLSPGFPSFDMFKNFEERGQQFNESIPTK